MTNEKKYGLIELQYNEDCPYVDDYYSFLENILRNIGSKHKVVVVEADQNNYQELHHQGSPTIRFNGEVIGEEKIHPNMSCKVKLPSKEHIENHLLMNMERLTKRVVQIVEVPLIGYALLQSPLSFGLNWKAASNADIEVYTPSANAGLEQRLEEESKKGLIKTLIFGVGSTGGAVAAGSTYAGASAAAVCAGVCEAPVGVAVPIVGNLLGLGTGAILTVASYSAAALYLIGLMYKNLGKRNIIKNIDLQKSSLSRYHFNLSSLDNLVAINKIKDALNSYNSVISEKTFP